MNKIKRHPSNHAMSLGPNQQPPIIYPLRVIHHLLYGICIFCGGEWDVIADLQSGLDPKQHTLHKVIPIIGRQFR